MIGKDRFFIFKNWWYFVGFMVVIAVVITLIEVLWLK